MQQQVVEWLSLESTETEQCTGLVRWVGRMTKVKRDPFYASSPLEDVVQPVLQQQFAITTITRGVASGQRFEWRDVPMECEARSNDDGTQPARTQVVA
jgi:hypothetical protein